MGSYGSLKSQDVEKSMTFFAFFWKSDPLREICQNSVPKVVIATPIDVLCSNFVKFGQREVDKVVHYLPTKNKLSLLRGSRPKSARASP